MQLDYTAEPAIGIPGQIARASAFQDIVTGVIPEEGQPEIVDIVFAGTWAPNDDVATTIFGMSIPTTNIVGATFTAARNEHLATLQANANFNVIASAEAIDDDTIRITGKEIGVGSGEYYDLAVTAGETTAGDGTAVATTVQQAINSAAIAFGKGVRVVNSGTRGKEVALPSATGFIFGGVVCHSHAVDNRTLPGDAGAPATQPLNLMKKGYVYVTVEDAFQPGDAAFLRHTANGNNLPGGWRTDADTARADAVTGARFVTGGAAGAVGVLFLG